METKYTFVSDAKAHDVVGFYDYLIIQNLKTGKIYRWVRGMEDGKALDVSEGSLVATNGVTPFRKKSFTQTKGKITAITKAQQAVVTFDVLPNIVEGSVLRFNVADEYGMKEINGLKGKVVAINGTAKTATVDIDTTSFTAFAVPETPKSIADAIVVGIAPGCEGLCGNTGVPVGSDRVGLTLGTGVVGAAGDTIVVQGGVLLEECTC